METIERGSTKQPYWENKLLYKKFSTLLLKKKLITNKVLRVWFIEGGAEKSSSTFSFEHPSTPQMAVGQRRPQSAPQWLSLALSLLILQQTFWSPEYCTFRSFYYRENYSVKWWISETSRFSNDNSIQSPHQQSIAVEFLPSNVAVESEYMESSAIRSDPLVYFISADCIYIPIFTGLFSKVSCLLVILWGSVIQTLINCINKWACGTLSVFLLFLLRMRQWFHGYQPVISTCPVCISDWLNSFRR